MSNPPDIRNHPNFPYFKAFYENKLKEIKAQQAKATAPQNRMNPVPPAGWPTGKPVVSPVPLQPAQGAQPVQPVQSIPAKLPAQAPAQAPVQAPAQVNTPPPTQYPNAQPVQRGEPGFRNLRNPVYTVVDPKEPAFPKNPLNQFNQLYQNIPVYKSDAYAPELSRLPQTTAIPGTQNGRRVYPGRQAYPGRQSESYQAQMYRDSRIDHDRAVRRHAEETRAGNTVEKVIEYRPRVRNLPTLREIQAHQIVTYDPPTMPRDKYLRQQYTHPRIKPSYKFHGMVAEREYQPRPFMESDIPELNPYALISDDGSGYEVGKLYAYDPTSF